MSSCSDRPTLKETTLKALPVSSSPRYTCYLYLSKSIKYMDLFSCYSYFSSSYRSYHFLLTVSRQPLLSVYSMTLCLFVFLFLISLPAAFLLIMSYQPNISPFWVIISYILFSHLLLAWPYTLITAISSLSSSFFPLCLWFFFLPPRSSSLFVITFDSSDYNFWCKCHIVTMLKVGMFVCTVADLITD